MKETHKIGYTILRNVLKYPFKLWYNPKIIELVIINVIFIINYIVISSFDHDTFCIYL